MPAVEMSSDVLLLCPKGDSNLLGSGEGAGKMEEELEEGGDGKKEVRTQPLPCDDVMATRYVDMLSGDWGRL